MKVRFTRQAADDIAAIADYIRAENPGAAQRVCVVILDAVQTLSRFPRLGRLQSEGARKLVTSPYSYAVYYVADDAADEIVVLTVRHPSRRPAS